MVAHVPQSYRHGLSAAELLGCVLAIAGGVWIGATYFGVDLNGAAYQALDETELLTRLPEEWRPTNPDCPGGDCPSEEEVRTAQQDQLRAELDSLRLEVALLAGGSSVQPIDDGALSEADAIIRDRTEAYWRRLTQIVFEVAAIQDRVAPLATTAELGRVLAVRRRALEYGEQAAQLLPIEGVDERAIETGVRVAEWFGRGADTIGQAIDLRTRQTATGRSLPAGDFLAQAEAELKQRHAFVRRKAVETGAYLAGRYFVEFPPLGL